MAKKKSNYRPKVRDKDKKVLIRQAGDKCANPGCPNTLVELHHIKQWHVYKRHDQNDMIAICPTCHSHAHHGRLMIDDQTIRSWKRISRPRSNRGHIYVEPSDRTRILLGTMLFMSDQVGPQSATVFELSSFNRLGFRVVGRDIVNLFLSVTEASGRKVLEVIDGHIDHDASSPLCYDNRPGRVRVTAPATPEYLPAWVAIACFGPDRAAEIEEGRFTLVDIEVLAPGFIRAKGMWAEDRRAVVVGRQQMAISSTENSDGSVGFVYYRGYSETPGDGGIAAFEFNGPLTHSSMFRALLSRKGF